MTSIMQKGFAMLLVCLLTPAFAGATGEEDDRIAALEARVAALEERLNALLSTDEEDAEAPVQHFPLGSLVHLGDGRALTVTSFDTDVRFRYSPSGGLSTQALIAKTGYHLLMLNLSIANSANEALQTSRLVNATLYYGDSYKNQAQNTFFYLNSRGVYSGGMKDITPGSTVDGCLLFAVPSGIDFATDTVTVRLQYGNQLYECTLRADPADPVE